MRLTRAFNAGYDNLYLNEDDVDRLLKGQTIKESSMIVQMEKPQRPWVGLTDEQIDAEHDRLFPKPAFNFDRQNVRNFARAIEAKLKQKNGFAEEENT